MKERLLITTAIGLMLGTAVFAQSPNEQSRTKSPPAAQGQADANQTNSNSSRTNSNSSAPPAQQSQNAQSAPSGSQQPAATTGQSSTTGNNNSTRSQAQSNQASPPSQAQNNNAGKAPSQAQPGGQPNSPSRAQSNTAPPANNQTQNQAQPTPSANTNAGTQPSNNAGAQQQPNNQTSTAQSRSSTNVNISANLNDNQRTRFSELIARLNVSPATNVNFSLSVGTAVPRDVRLRPLPADVVEIVPQYRGYNFVVVREDIVIVEPSTYKIVDVLPRRGKSTAVAPASRKTTISERDRDVIRKQSRSRTEQPRTERRTTGSASTSTRIRVGDRLPDSVEIRSFPDEVYRDSPSLREYRYIERDNRTYVIDPGQRTIIEEID